MLGEIRATDPPWGKAAIIQQRRLASQTSGETAVTPDDIKRAGEALYRYAQETGFSCPPSWTPHWREWYRKLALIVVDAIRAPKAEDRADG